MLVLTRRQNEQIIIGDGVWIDVLRIGHGRVRLGIAVPDGGSIHRIEVHRQILQQRDHNHKGDVSPDEGIPANAQPTG